MSRHQKSPSSKKNFRLLRKKTKSSPRNVRERERKRERYKRKHAHHLQFVGNAIAFCRDEEEEDDDDDDESEEFARVLDFFSFFFFFFFFFEELENAPVLDEE